MKKYDVLIVGGGAAGMTAAIYTCRKKLKTAVLSADWGGQTLLTNHIENYPGFELIPGPELMSKFRMQAEKFGADLITQKIVKIEKKKNLFYLETGDGENYEAKAIIISSGKTPRRLGIPGEDKFFGKGVSTCATCDAPFFHDKTVAVIGGGNSALEAAELLSKIAKKIYLIHRREEFRADEITVEKVKKLKKVELFTSKIPVEIKGDKFVEFLTIEDINSKDKEEIKVDGIFSEIGWELDTDWLRDLVKRNKGKEIIIDDRCRTSQPGFFAAGDVSSVPYKQTVISAGEGAKAGLEAYKYIKGVEIVTDWK